MSITVLISRMKSLKKGKPTQQIKWFTVFINMEKIGEHMASHKLT